MLDREPFLKAIFANPADDLPRLVFADYLEEHGDGEWAELIRLECDLASYPMRIPREEMTHEMMQRLMERKDRAETLQYEIFCSKAHDKLIEAGALIEEPPTRDVRCRGFREFPAIDVRIDQLGETEFIRKQACASNPEWYGAESLRIYGGRLTPIQLIEVLNNTVAEHVTELDLSGEVIETPAILNDIETNQGIPVFDMETRPVVNLAVVEALAQSREARRLVTLN